MRVQMAGGVLLIPLLWFGIPALTSNSPFSPATLAEKSPRRIHGNKITGTISASGASTRPSSRSPPRLAAVLAVIRRDRPVLLLTGGVVLWVGVEAAFALHGWSAVPRYMYEAAAGVECWPEWPSAGDSRTPRAARRLWPGARVATVGARGRTRGRCRLCRLARAGGPRPDHGRGQGPPRTAHADQVHQPARQRRGPSRRRSDPGLRPAPTSAIGWQSILAWQLGTNVGSLYFSRRHEIEHPHPIENMYPHSYGWQFFPSDWTNPTQAARCRGLTYRT